MVRTKSHHHHHLYAFSGWETVWPPWQAWKAKPNVSEVLHSTPPFSFYSTPPTATVKKRFALPPLSNPLQFNTNGLRMDLRWRLATSSVLICIIKFSGFNACLFLLLHSQQSKRRYFLVQGPQVLNFVNRLRQLLHSKNKTGFFPC